MDQPKKGLESKVVFVCGQSGAGKSKAIDALEDIGFKSIDNLPLSMVEMVLSSFLEDSRYQKVAISLAIKGKNAKEDILNLKERLSGKIDHFFLFLVCSETALCDRFSATRRKHPYIDEGGELIAAIRREAHDLSELEGLSDASFDTTSWSPHYLARSVEKTFAGPGFARKLHVTLTSFGFKYGQLNPIDSLFDVRFLPNPFFDPELKHKTGLSKEVAAFMSQDSEAVIFLDKLVSLFEYLIPHYYNEGKHYLRIGIGCTGGMHRSVWIAEALGRRILEKDLEHTLVGVMHRDLKPGSISKSLR